MAPRKEWKTTEEAYLRRHYATANWRDLVINLGRTQYAIRARATQLGLHRAPREKCTDAKKAFANFKYYLRLYNTLMIEQGLEPWKPRGDGYLKPLTPRGDRNVRLRDTGRSVRPAEGHNQGRGEGVQGGDGP